MSTREDAHKAVEQAETYLNGQRTAEAQAYALVAIAKQLDRIARKLG